MSEYLNKVWEDFFTPPDTREIWDWALEEGELPPVYASQLDVDEAPMIKEPWRALRNPSVRNVVAMAAVQCLKTLIGELWLLWLVPNDPGATQWLQPDDQEAWEHCEERFVPLIERYAAVHRYFTGKGRDKKTAFIRFKHMFMRIEGANNMGNLQRKSIKNQMRSEIHQVDKWVPGRLKEADGRLTQFVHNSKTYTESQPGYDAELQIDDMHAEYLKGDQNIWEFACLSCGKYQPYLWSHVRADGTRAAMRWETSERTRRPNGEWRETELLKTIRYECIYCGHAHYDDPLTRRRMTANGRFRAQNPDADPATRSFCWNQLAMGKLSWWETKIGGVKNFLIAHAKAKRGYEKDLREFFQKVVAEPYNPAKHGAFSTLETIDLSSGCAPDENKWFTLEGIVFKHRIMGVDVQALSFFAVVEIWSDNGDSLTLWAGELFSWDDVRSKQEEHHVPDGDVGIDISHRGHEVIVQCAKHGHWEDTKRGKVWVCWKAWRGSHQEHFTWRPISGPQKGQRIQLPYSWPPGFGEPLQGKSSRDPKWAKLFLEFKGKRCWIVAWSNPTIKDIVICRRDGRASGVRSLIARGDWNQLFSSHMHSQKKVSLQQKSYDKGKPATAVSKWVWDSFRADHLFDAKCMVTVRAVQKVLILPGGEAATGAPTNSPEALENKEVGMV